MYIIHACIILTFFSLLILDLVCSTIGFDKSLPICCSPFGALPNKQLFKDFRCSGSEDNILRCPHTFQSYGVQCSSSLEYASVLCYNGDRKSGDMTHLVMYMYMAL